MVNRDFGILAGRRAVECGPNPAQTICKTMLYTRSQVSALAVYRS